MKTKKVIENSLQKKILLGEIKIFKPQTIQEILILIKIIKYND